MNKNLKVLILRFGAIGDVVHSTELFRSIKRACPGSEIHYAAFKTPSLNIKNDPDLEKVWIAEGKSYKQLRELAKELRKEKFDLFINLQPGIRTRIFALMLGAGKTLTYRKTFLLHAVENFWRTAKPVFKNMKLGKNLKLYIEEQTQNKISEMLNKTRPLIAFNMGVSGTRQGRRWPQEYWIDLAGKILQTYDCEIILTGSKDDKNFSDPVLKVSDRVKSFCGEVSVDENTALLSKCDVVVSGDTGPLHIATALGCKSIGLYGAAPVSRTGPYGENSVAVFSGMECVPCNRRKCRYTQQGEIYTPCMIDITSDMVFERVRDFLGTC